MEKEVAQPFPRTRDGFKPSSLFFWLQEKCKARQLFICPCGASGKAASEAYLLSSTARRIRSNRAMCSLMRCSFIFSKGKMSFLPR